MKTLSTKDLSLGYSDSIVVDKLNLSVPEGKISVLIGANGCGKSTILRSLARLLQPKSGLVLLDGLAIARMPTKEVAKSLAILPQGPSAPEGLTVMQLVRQGRYPYQKWFKQWTKKDEEVVTRAMRSTGILDLADRQVDALSGGQRQRAWIAMTLAQETGIILLDEPTTYLDMSHQIEILDLLFDLNQREGRTIVMVLHDLNLACRYAHHIIAIRSGKVYAEGRPEEIVDARLVRDVFHLECQITSDPLLGTPLCIPYGKGRYMSKSVPA